jgi:hypothetical protein
MSKATQRRLFTGTCILSSLLSLAFLATWVFTFFGGIHAWYVPEYGAATHRWQYVVTCSHEGVRVTAGHMQRVNPAYRADTGASLRFMPRFKSSTMYESERNASRVRLPGVLWYGQTFGVGSQSEYGGVVEQGPCHHLIFSPLLPALLAVIFPALWLTRFTRSRCRRLRGLCSNCGYDLRATAGRCPECGGGKLSGNPTC